MYLDFYEILQRCINLINKYRDTHNVLCLLLYILKFAFKLEKYIYIVSNTVRFCHFSVMGSVYLIHCMGAQWLSGRVLESKPKGRGFEPHRRHCVLVLEQDTFMLA